MNEAGGGVIDVELAQYRQSLLKATVEGALPADWRSKNRPTETGAQLLARIRADRAARAAVKAPRGRKGKEAL